MAQASTRQSRRFASRYKPIAVPRTLRSRARDTEGPVMKIRLDRDRASALATDRHSTHDDGQIMLIAYLFDVVFQPQANCLRKPRGPYGSEQTLSEG